MIPIMNRDEAVEALLGRTVIEDQKPRRGRPRLTALLLGPDDEDDKLSIAHALSLELYSDGCLTWIDMQWDDDADPYDLIIRALHANPEQVIILDGLRHLPKQTLIAIGESLQYGFLGKDISSREAVILMTDGAVVHENESQFVPPLEIASVIDLSIRYQPRSVPEASVTSDHAITNV